jgi:ABC-type spermidine/putrescine transport system permease subunit II
MKAVRRLPTLVALIVLLVVLYAPLLRLSINAFNANELGTTWGGATGRWFRAVFENKGLLRAARNSALLAMLTAILSSLIGTAAVLAMRSLPIGGRALVRIGSLARVTTPEILVATGLFVLLPLANQRLGFRSMLIGHVAYLSGFVVLLVAARLAQFDTSLEEAAADLGARPARVMWTIVLPDLRPAILAAGLLAAAFSFDDVALSRSLSSPDSQTLPLFLVSLVQRKATPEIDAIAVLMLVISVALFAAAIAVARGATVVVGGTRSA